MNPLLYVTPHGPTSTLGLRLESLGQGAQTVSQADAKSEARVSHPLTNSIDAALRTFGVGTQTNAAG
jgi:hypothetical protein